MLMVGLYSSEFFLWANKFFVMVLVKSLNPGPPCLKFLYGRQSSDLLETFNVRLSELYRGIQV